MTIRTEEERVHGFLCRQMRKKKKGWDFSSLADPRRVASVVREYVPLIWQTIFGLLSNQPSLRDAEDMKLAGFAREMVPELVSDTTLDTELRRMDDQALHDNLVLQVRESYRSKKLRPSVLPFGVATIDGKNLATLDHDANGTGHIRSKNNEKWHKKDVGLDGEPYWLMPALRSVLTSAESKPHIFQYPLPPGTGESTNVRDMVDEMHRVYGRSGMIEVFDVDAGLTSLANWCHFNDLGYGVVMGLKGNQPDLFAEAQRLLIPMTKVCSPEARTPWERREGKEIRRSLWRTNELRDFTTSAGCWENLRQGWLVRQETRHSNGQVKIEDRYFLTSILWNRLSPWQILALVRAHWGIEVANNAMDVQWGEDNGRWCTQGRSVWVLGVLRMMVCNVAQHCRRRLLRLKDPRGGLRPPLSWRKLFKAIERALAGHFASVESATTCV